MFIPALVIFGIPYGIVVIFPTLVFENSYSISLYTVCFWASGAFLLWLVDLQVLSFLHREFQNGNLDVQFTSYDAEKSKLYRWIDSVVKGKYFHVDTL